MSDTNYLLYFENIRTKNRILPARDGKNIFFLEVKKKIIGSQEKFGSVGKQQTNNFLMLASNLKGHLRGLSCQNRCMAHIFSHDYVPCSLRISVLFSFVITAAYVVPCVGPKSHPIDPRSPLWIRACTFNIHKLCLTYLEASNLPHIGLFVRR